MDDNGASQPHTVSTSPRIVVQEHKIREKILNAAPAFLDPARFSREEVYHAAVVVLISFAHGSETAARLIEIRELSDPMWPKLDRDQALGYLDVLYRYLAD